MEERVLIHRCNNKSYPTASIGRVCGQILVYIAVLVSWNFGWRVEKSP